MSKYERHQHPVQTNPYFDRNANADDDGTVDAEDENWNPTPEVFEAFLVRDFQLAQRNIEMATFGRKTSMTLKEVKESTLHSVDTVEQVLSSMVASGKMTENKGRYERTGLGR
jgi:hypothetical protein